MVVSPKYEEKGNLLLLKKIALNTEAFILTTVRISYNHLSFSCRFYFVRS